MAARWRPWVTAKNVEPFPHVRRDSSERPGAVKGAPLLGAAKRTLDGEDRSKMIEMRERRGEQRTKDGAAILAPSATATNIILARETRATYT
jgi:hypothetical protein